MLIRSHRLCRLLAKFWIRFPLKYFVPPHSLTTKLCRRYDACLWRTPTFSSQSVTFAIELRSATYTSCFCFPVRTVSGSLCLWTLTLTVTFANKYLDCNASSCISSGRLQSLHQEHWCFSRFHLSCYNIFAIFPSCRPPLLEGFISFQRHFSLTAYQTFSFVVLYQTQPNTVYCCPHFKVVCVLSLQEIQMSKHHKHLH